MRSKRLLCILLAAVMLFSQLPLSYATGSSFYLVGSMNGWTETEGYQFSSTDAEGEYVLRNIELFSGTTLKVKNSANNTWYPDPGDNYTVTESGRYDVTFCPGGSDGEGWWYRYFKLEKVGEAGEAPAPEYYLVGDMNDWKATDGYQLTATENEGEYALIGVELPAGVGVKIFDAANNLWYPDRGDNCPVTDAGIYDVWFHSDVDPSSADYQDYFTLRMTGIPSAAESHPMRVYFVDQNGFDEVYVYAFCCSTHLSEKAVWPGEKLETIGTDHDGNKIYMLELETQLYDNVILNNGKNGEQSWQTVDLPYVTDAGEHDHIIYYCNSNEAVGSRFKAWPAFDLGKLFWNMKVALITDAGGVKDGGFNQQVDEAAKAWCTDNGVDITSYVFEDSDNMEAENYGVAIVEQAISEGANVLLLPGFIFTDPTAGTAALHPDVTYILMDVDAYSLLDAMGDPEGNIPENVYLATYREEQSGYLAGYAAVAMGYNKLGFLGGIAVPSVVRFGYGFVQGANAAAAALDRTDEVEVTYAYTGQFMPDAEMTEFVGGWYQDGVEVVFACGGGIYASAAEAAAANGGKLIGVDADQKAQIESEFGAGLVITSATKNMGATAVLQLDALKNNTFMGGREENCGVVSAVPGENPVGLAPSTVYNDSFTEEAYAALLAKLVGDELTVSDDVDNRPDTAIDVSYVCYPGCDWDAPTYVWGEAHRCTATRVCRNDPDHIETETVTATGEITKEPTVTAEGETTYTATFTNQAFATQTKKEPIPCLGRDVTVYVVDQKKGEALYAWAWTNGGAANAEGWPGALLTGAENDKDGNPFYTFTLNTVDYATGLIFNYGEGQAQTADIDWVADAGEATNLVYYLNDNEGSLKAYKGTDVWPESSKVAVSATCTEAGSVKYTGLLTGEELTETVVALGHNLGDWTQSKAPTCTEKGEERRDCSRCDYYETRDLDALGHTWNDGEVTTAPTLTQEGVMTYTCTVCHATRTEPIEKLPAVDTAALEAAIAAAKAIVRNDYTAGSLADLDAALEAAEAALISDTLTQAAADAAANALELAKTNLTLKDAVPFTVFVVDENDFDTLKFYAFHQEDPIVEKAAWPGELMTLLGTDRNGHPVYKVEIDRSRYDYVIFNNGKDGSESWQTLDLPYLADANDIGKDFIVYFLNSNEAVEGKYKAWPTTDVWKIKEEKAATCLEAGEITLESFVTGATEVENGAAALGHDFGDWMQSKAATCTEKGEERRDCSRCDAFETRDVAALGHDFAGEWTVTTPPTCTEAGVESQKCSRCDATQTRPVDPLGHNLGEWAQSKAPTCTEKGEEKRTCSRCDYFETREVDALGHNLGEWAQSKAPTCTEKGEEKRACSRCDYYETRDVNALGHNLGEWAQSKAPTCTEKGEEKRACSRCDYFETREVDALGHAWSAWTHDAASDPSTHSRACSRCTATETEACSFYDDSCTVCSYSTYSDILIQNGDFESGLSGWMLSGVTGELIDNSSSATHKTKVLNLWVSNDAAAEVSVAYAVKLTAGEYRFEFDLDGENMTSGLRWAVLQGETALVSGSSELVTTGWDKWQTVKTDRFTLDEPAEVVFVLRGTEPAGYWGHLDNLKLYGTGALYQEDVQDPNAGIYVPKLAEVGKAGFIRGTDVSSYLSLVNSGAKYYDFDGNELSNQGFFDLLADCGFNYIRLRVWNDPYDAQGNGYGGGNCDLEAARTMGKWATDAGMKVLIDFHYSDFWADPGKQLAPKAWSGYTVQQKAAAVTSYTTASLNALIAAGVNVGMVQIGNETNGSFCGETNWDSICTLFSAGANAVRAVDPDILVALHFTNPEKANLQAGYAAKLASHDVDYDVFATSWYPYWHGTTDNLTAVLKNIADTYDKKVIIAETSWAWTLDDGDGWDNTVSRSGNNTGNAYPFSVQGQANELGAAANAILATGENGLGLFYWENAWIPVQYAYTDSGELDQAILASNQQKWEQFGSGWAASYGGGYQVDAATWYGGSAVDNQAMFDFHGRALPSLKTFQYMMNGAAQTIVESVEEIDAVALTCEVGDTLTLPETVGVQYGVAGKVDETVTWNAAQLAAVDMSTAGTYTVIGVVTVTKVEGEFKTTATVTVQNPNLLTANPGFESEDLSMYEISGASRTWDDPHGGSCSLHFYNANGGTVELSTQLRLAAGTYSFSLYAQGDTVGTAGQLIYATVGETTTTQSFALSGWANWQNPIVTFTVPAAQTVTVGMTLPFGKGGWGTVDDLAIRLIEAGTEPEPEIVGQSLTLGGDIGVNLYLDLGDADPSDATVTLSWGEGYRETVALDALTTVHDDVYGECYRLTTAMPAKQMTEEVTAVLTVGGVELQTVKTSVKAYAETILADTAHEKYPETLWKLAQDMLIYGAYAQEFFDYNTENPACDLSGVTLTAPTGLSVPSYTEDQFAAYGLQLVGVSLLLKANTALRLYFRVIDAEKFAAAEVRCQGELLTPTGNAGLVSYTVYDIAPKDLADDVTLRFGEQEIAFNVASYLSKALEGEDAALADLVKALWAYHLSAAAYFQ